MFRKAITETHAEGNDLVALCDVNESRLALSAGKVPRKGNGVATYANGSPILVNPTSGAPVATGGVPLTLAMINDPSSPLYAAPNADSGSITGAALRTALSTSNPLAARA